MGGGRRKKRKIGWIISWEVGGRVEGRRRKVDQFKGGGGGRKKLSDGQGRFIGLCERWGEGRRRRKRIFLLSSDENVANKRQNCLDNSCTVFY